MVVLALITEKNRVTGLIGAFTTSQPWRQSDKEPFYRVWVGQDEAAKMNQRPFAIDCSSIAFLPISQTFIPEFGSGRHGIIGHFGAAAANRLTHEIVSKVAQRGLVRQYGPLAPQIASRACRQLSNMNEATNWTAARKVLASLS